MANNFLTPDIIAREALMVLENNLVMANLVHRDYSDELVQAGDTVTIRRPARFTAKNFTGEISRQDATEEGVTVKIDRHRDVSIDVTSREMTLDIRSFSDQLIRPAMRAIAQAVDEDLLNTVAEATQSVQGTANATDLKDIAAMAKKLDMAGVPTDLRRLVLHPEHKYRYATVENLSKVAFAGGADALKRAELGMLYTMDTYMDQNCPDTKAATAGTATAYKVSGTKGQSKVALSSVTAATGTIKKGDAFILDGYLYRFTADATAASGAVSEVGIDTELIKDYTEAEAYPVRAPHSLAFHRNAIALVTRPLALPMGAAKAAIMSDNGLGVRVVFGYNQNTKKDTVSLDVIYGVKLLDPSMAVRLVG